MVRGTSARRFQLQFLPHTLSAVEGDTVECNGVNMRALGDGPPNRSGFDTPEIYRPKCQQELELGRTAKSRMQELISQSGVRGKDSSVRDRYQRLLILVILLDGRSAGSVLIGEGLARRWTPGYRANWCASIDADLLQTN
ncbi:endonuclease YncB(thermonuclease family) [Labrenzia sp. EL_195]|nr:endonuclease YncB(thermonuclease family) [Labrenzia sp. EL_195]